MLKTIKFLTPNARRQAGDWLLRKNIPHQSRLLTITSSDIPAELESVNNHYVLILPPSVGDETLGIAWNVIQAGTYGISHSELSWISGVPFLYQAGTSALLVELRSAIVETRDSGKFEDKLIFNPQVSGDVHYYQVLKKKGVKLANK